MCGVCRSRFVGEAGELAELSPLLEAAGAASLAVSYSTKVTGTRSPGVPVSLDIVDLTLAARAGVVSDEYGDQIGEVPLASRLDGWVGWVWSELRAAGELGRKPLPTTPALAGWLAVPARVEWMSDNFAAFPDLAREVRVSLWAVRRALSISRPPRYLPSPCPVCSALGVLVLESSSGYVVCRSCSAAYTPDELGERLAAARLTSDA